MDDRPFEYTSHTRPTTLLDEDEANWEYEENETNSDIEENLYQIDILELINKRRKTSSEYLTNAQVEKITKAEDTVDDVNRIFQDITSTLQKLLVDISLLERSQLTHDIDSNWENLNEISDEAINACDRSFGKRTVSTAKFEYRLGNQVGRILASLTGKATEDQRASSFHAGLSNAYTKNDASEYRRTRDLPPSACTGNDDGGDSKDYPDRSDLNDQGPKRILSIPIREYAPEFSTMTRNFIRMYGYNMDMDVINMASAAHSHLALPITFMRDRKELHNDIVRLLEDGVGWWFGMCVEIRSELDKEWDEINKAGVSGLPAKQALSELWDMTIVENRVSAESDQIAKSYKKSSYEKQVTTVFNSLSYQSKTNYSQADKQLVHDTAVVTYDQGWKLTPYGYLLCFYELHAGDTDMGKVALDEIEMMREDNVLGKSVEFDRELVRQGLEQFYDMDVPKHF
jgi:hypothetical protein